MRKRCFFAILTAIFMLLSGCVSLSAVIGDASPGETVPASAEPEVSVSPQSSPSEATPSPASTPSPTPTPALTPTPAPPASIRILTPAQADDIDFAVYSEGLFCVYNGYYGEPARKYGFMRANGAQVTEFLYDYAYPFSQGLACVRLDGKYGFIDTSGAVALPLIYDSAAPFVEGLAYFERGGTYGFIRKNGDTAFLLDCDSVSTFREGLAFFSVDGKYGYIDTNGNIAIAPDFDDAGYFAGGLAKVRSGDAFGIIDRTGTFVVPPVYDDITCDGEFFMIESRGLFGLLDSEANTILPPVYSYIQPLPGGGSAIAGTESDTQIIGFDGTVLLADTYDFWGYDECGLIRVSADGKYGCLDAADLSVRIPAVYDYIYYFTGEYATAQISNKYGVIDKLGNVIVPFEYEYVKIFSNNTFAASTDGEYRLLNEHGDTVQTKRYGSIRQSGDGYVVQIGYDYGFLDANGREVIAPVYDYCFDRVYGADNCYVVIKGYGARSHSIAVLGDIRSTDITHMLLRNEITPRIKPYSQFIKNGFVEHGSLESGQVPERESIEYDNDFIHHYKLYGFDDGIPVMYFFARPFQSSGFPMSYSGFYAVSDGKLNALTTGYECGGSLGGDYICFWKDDETSEVYLGTACHYGGFGGHAYGGSVYNYNGGSAELLVSFEYVTQIISNYYLADLIENAHTLYDEDGLPYTEETVLQAYEDHGSVSEYTLNGRRVTVEKYVEATARYSMVALWGWPGY